MANNSISVGGDFEGSLIQDSTVKGDVSVAISKLPSSPNPAKPGIKELLEQLDTTIEAEQSLDAKKKEKARKQIEALAKAAQNSNDKERKEQAEDAITFLKGIFSGIQSTASLFLTLSQLFGLV